MRHPSGYARNLALALILTSWAPCLAAQGSAPEVADPDPARFAEAFADFAAWDAKNAVPENGILFTGSSSIVRWNTGESFPDLPVINRGFGGSQASDVTHWVREGVIEYDPAIVVYYAGDNDANAGKQAEQIFTDMREFAEAVTAADPTTQIMFLSVKPSLSRWARWNVMQETNALLEDYADARPNVHYVDVGTRMLGRDGTPIPELFVSDGLHMTPAGYVIWNDIVGRALRGLSHR